MEDGARIERMIEILLADHPEHSFLVRQCGKGYGERRSLLQGLMVLRPPGPLSEEFYRLEGALLDEERGASGLIDALSLPASALPKITHFHGDMLRLVADAYVNEASGELQGCFVPGHRSLDSRIHSAAGLELRNACKTLFDKDKPIEPGYAGMTKGYHLAAPYVIHAVGPSIRGRVRDIDLNAPFIVAKAVIPSMIKKGHGKIINICSMMSELGRETVSAYAAAKGGLKMLTKNIASEYGEYNIQCNGIGPGYIATPQTAPLREIQPDGSRHPFDQFIIAKTPAARWGEAEDLGGPAVFLASDASNFVNGHILYVDGGILAYIGKQP